MMDPHGYAAATPGQCRSMKHTPRNAKIVKIKPALLLATKLVPRNVLTIFALPLPRAH